MNVLRLGSSQQRLLLAGLGGALVLVLALVALGVISGFNPLPVKASPTVTAVQQ